MTGDEPDAAASALNVGFVPGVTLTKWRRVWAERFPRTPLAVVEVPEADQRAALDSRLVDLCFVRLPLPAEGLHTIRLYDEVPVVVLPKDHPLAASDEVTLADLAGQQVLDAGLPDAFDRVAWGAGVLLVPHAVARSRSRRDLTYRPVAGAPPTTVALAWLRDDPHELTDEFIGVVRGRTVNSARTAAARAARGTPPPAERPAPAASRRPTRRQRPRGR